MPYSELDRIVSLEPPTARVRRALRHIRVAVEEGLEELALESDPACRQAIAHAVQSQVRWAVEEIEQTLVQEPDHAQLSP